MGWLTDIAEAVGLSSGTKHGTFVEGKESNPHQHGDKTYGTDIEAYRNTYDDDGKLVHSEKAKDWGKIHK